MSEYLSLYRKYRPDTFSELKGQEETVTTIKNQIRSDKISHAYMLTGTRGTGKTTTAKLIAKAVNCLDSQDGEPCLKCSACLNHHKSMDIVEIDAASNRGIDDIRRIKEDVQYRPTENKYKVYIIDEVHMLTKEAYNALLKTLEEPPSYVIFILATTEFYKVPATIRSRCQKFEYNRIPLETMVERMQYICGKEGKIAETSALRLIALNSDGALRDALSMLEQAFAISDGMKLTESIVTNMLGCSNSEMVMEFAKATLTMELNSINSIMSFLSKKGKDAVMLLNDAIKILRDTMLVSVTGGNADIEGTSEYVQSVLEISKWTKVEKLIYSIAELNSIAYKAKFSVNPQIAVETGLTLFCLPAIKETDYTSMSVRLDSMEDKLNAIINSGKVVTTEICVEKTTYKPSIVELEDYLSAHTTVSVVPQRAQGTSNDAVNIDIAHTTETTVVAISEEGTLTQEAVKDITEDASINNFVLVNDEELAAEIEAVFPTDGTSDVSGTETGCPSVETISISDTLEVLKRKDPILVQLLSGSKVEIENNIVKVSVVVPDFKFILEDIYADKFKNVGLELQVA